MKKMPAFLYIIVSVTGASVLALEILGTRILGPFYGVSLFLWSALITVTLAALSVGYLLGGSWADRGAGLKQLCLIVGGAGLWTVAIPWMRHAVILLAEPWGLRTAVLASATILFFPPLMFLGAATPFAIRLMTTAVDSVGRVAGRMFAVSTMASVLSALLTGFWLVPHFGIALMTAAIGTLLLATAAAGLLLASRAGKALPAGLLLLAAASALTAPVERPDPARGLLSVRQSPYAEIRVFENEYGRHLLIDGGVHSRMDTSSWRSTLPYTAVMEIPRRYFDRPGSMLLVGLGGGSLVRDYIGEGWSVDAVDIDPEVISTAEEYFDLPSDRAGVYEMDGRRFLTTAGRRYDVVLIDAFGSSSIPFHLVTKEAFREAAAAMTPDGVLAINVICVGWHDPIVRTIAATLREVFPEVLALPMAEPPDRLGNLILLAAARPLGEIEDPERNVEMDPGWRYSPAYAVTHAWDNRFVPATGGTRALTDDLNPVDLRSEEIKTVARKELRAYFNKLDLSW